MVYGLTLHTAPDEEPLGLPEAKDHLRVAHEDEDGVIADLIVAARQWIEEATYRQLITATWDLVLDGFPSGYEPIVIPRAPLQSVTSVTYTDSAGDSQTLATSVYKVCTSRQPGEVRLKYAQVWPETLIEPDVVTVRFVAGYGDCDEVPALLKSAMKLIIGQLYEHREELVERKLEALPLGAQRIIRMYDLGDELTDYGVWRV